MRRAARSGPAAALALLALAGAGCGGEDGRGAEADPRVPVRVHAAERRPIARTVTLSARLQPSETVEIRPRVSGRILAFHKKEGDFVRAGDLLVELDPTEPRLQLERAEAAVAQADARLEEAERALARTRQMFEQHVISQAALDQAEVEARIARADRKTAVAGRNLAAQRLADTRVTAPIDGVLQERQHSVGDLVGGASFGRGGPGDGAEPAREGGEPGGPTLFTLIQIDPLLLEFNVAEQDVPYVRHTDRPFPIRVDVRPDAEWVGYVDYIAPSLHPQAHTQLIRLRVANPGGRLKPGMFARMETTREVADDALVVRADALLDLGGGYGAYVVNGEGTANLRRLEVAFVTENHAAVTAGLERGEQVVYEGQTNLRDGTAVRVVAPETPVAAPPASPAAAPAPARRTAGS